jgi:hypothetical protein
VSDGVSLKELEVLACGEASRIEAVQGALVADKHRAEPDAGEMAKARKFDAIGKLIGMVRTDAQLIARVRELAQRAAPAAKPEAKRS